MVPHNENAHWPLGGTRLLQRNNIIVLLVPDNTAETSILLWLLFTNIVTFFKTALIS
jgi:hypothetical protein